MPATVSPQHACIFALPFQNHSFYLWFSHYSIIILLWLYRNLTWLSHVVFYDYIFPSEENIALFVFTFLCTSHYSLYYKTLCQSYFIHVTVVKKKTTKQNSDSLPIGFFWFVFLLAYFSGLSVLSCLGLVFPRPGKLVWKPLLSIILCIAHASSPSSLGLISSSSGESLSVVGYVTLNSWDRVCNVLRSFMSKDVCPQLLYLIFSLVTKGFKLKIILAQNVEDIATFCL